GQSPRHAIPICQAADTPLSETLPYVLHPRCDRKCALSRFIHCSVSRTSQTATPARTEDTGSLPHSRQSCTNLASQPPPLARQLLSLGAANIADVMTPGSARPLVLWHTLVYYRERARHTACSHSSNSAHPIAISL